MRELNNTCNFQAVIVHLICGLRNRCRHRQDKPQLKPNKLMERNTIKSKKKRKIKGLNTLTIVIMNIMMGMKIQKKMQNFIFVNY